MSKEGNMEELQRWSMEIAVRPGAYSYGNESVGYEHDPDGEWVRFSDVQEREARYQARIEVKDDLLRAAYADTKKLNESWRERIQAAIEVELERYKREIETSEMWPANDPNFDWEHVRVPHLRSAGDAMSRVYVLRSLLDSGEEQKARAASIAQSHAAAVNTAVTQDCSDCGMAHPVSLDCPSPALEECTNCDGTGTRFSEVAWDDLTCGRCNGNKAVPAGSQEGKFGGPGVRRPSGSPALHREGRENGCRVTNLPAHDPDPITREQIEATAGPSAVTTNDESAPGTGEDENVAAVPERVEAVARAALSVMGSGKVEVNRDDLAEVAGFLQHMSGCSLVKFPTMKGHSCDCAMGRLRAVLEQEGGEGE